MIISINDNIKKLASLFPSAVKDGELDLEALKQELGQFTEVGTEKYELTWAGKQQAKQTAFTPILGRTLKYIPEESKNSETTQNLYIEGDNLEVLKLLRQNYYGAVKMIYIDPPYNTGNDFIYNDNFRMTKEESDIAEGDMSDLGERYTVNRKDHNRYHTNWLNMMYPRLRVAKDLLRDDGVIFISINDNEVHNLRKICDEIFGEENFVAILARKTKTTSNSGNQFAPSHEYIIVCARNIDNLNLFNDPEAQESEEYLKLFKKEDNYGKYNTIGLYQPSLKHGGSRYYIECPDGSKVITPNNLPWRWNEQTFLTKKNENRVVFIETQTSPLVDENGNQAKWNIYTKLYLKERLESGMRPISFIDKYTNSEGSKELLKMEIPFTFSKPRRLLQYLIKICGANQSDIIFDFFSGSSTTAHAVMQLNAEDNGNRKYIMVQLPETCDETSEAFKAGYKNICEIGKERIRRAGEKILEENKEKEGIENLDVGFKVFRVVDENF